MSRVQVRAVALTVLLSALDGYDVLSVTFAAPAITEAWNIGKAALGAVLSSGLAGMALGSLALAPAADLVGRKGVVLASLALMALGMLLSGLADGIGELAAWRFVTGLGIGACIAVINPLAAEFSNARRRPLAVALMALGFPVGGLIGGVLAASLLAAFGWPAVFFAGALGSAFLLPLVAFILPESPAFLASRRRPDSLARLNTLLVRCGHQQVAELPTRQEGKRGYAGVFAHGQVATTARLATVNILQAAASYFVLSWLPQMIGDAGFDPSRASLAAALASLAGIGGGVALGAAAPRFGLVRLTVGAIIGMALSTVALGLAAPSLPLLMAVAALCGLCLYSAAAGFYAVLASAFDDRARASGAGFVIGVGRVSSAVAPMLAGWLFAAGLARLEVCIVFAACSAAAAAILVTYPSREKAHA